MKQNKQTNIILIILCFLITLYLINSTLITKHVISYTKLFIEKLFPASFIFFTFSTLLIEYNIIQNLNNLTKKNSASIYIIIMSLISGFPSGSKYTKELLEKNLIDSKSANNLIKFTHFPNPIFILGSISVLYNEKKYAIIILSSIIISNLIMAIIFKTKDQTEIKLPTNKKIVFAKILSKAIYSTFKTLILIYGISLFFYLIITIINHYIKSSLYIYIFLNGIFDLTNGVFLTSLITNPHIKSLFIIFFISFGGLSIHMQTKSIIADTSINYKNFLIGRVIGTILSIIIYVILIHIF